MLLFAPKESAPGENRVAITPDSAKRLAAVGIDAAIEAGAVHAADTQTIWLIEAEKELKKIPFFVRGKARRNTETYAASRGVQEISIETLYEAKAHYAQ